MTDKLFKKAVKTLNVGFYEPVKNFVAFRKLVEDTELEIERYNNDIETINRNVQKAKRNVPILETNIENLKTWLSKADTEFQRKNYQYRILQNQDDLEENQRFLIFYKDWILDRQESIEILTKNLDLYARIDEQIRIEGFMARNPHLKNKNVTISIL